MKAELTSKKEEFKPIEITITLESPAEVADMWLRGMVSFYHVDKQFLGDHRDAVVLAGTAESFVDSSLGTILQRALCDIGVLK